MLRIDVVTLPISLPDSVVFFHALTLKVQITFSLIFVEKSDNTKFKKMNVRTVFLPNVINFFDFFIIIISV